MAKHRKGQTLEEYIAERYAEQPGLEQEVAKLVAEMSIEQDLIRLREDRGLSQVEAAQLLGVSQPAVAKLETGRVQNAKLSTLLRYATALGGRLKIEITKDHQHKLTRILRRVSDSPRRVTMRESTTGQFTDGPRKQLMTVEASRAKKRAAKA